MGENIKHSMKKQEREGKEKKGSSIRELFTDPLMTSPFLRV